LSRNQIVRIVLDVVLIACLSIVVFGLRVLLFGDGRFNKDALEVILSTVSAQNGDQPGYLIETHYLLDHIIVFTLCLALGWYAYGLTWKVRNWTQLSQLRSVWVILAIVSGAGPHVVLFFTAPDTTGGGYWIFLFAAFAWAIVFLLGSAVFSPSSHKYTVPALSRLRRGW
jgi:hypothetical protein